MLLIVLRMLAGTHAVFQTGQTDVLKLNLEIKLYLWPFQTNVESSNCILSCTLIMWGFFNFIFSLRRLANQLLFFSPSDLFKKAQPVNKIK